MAKLPCLGWNYNQPLHNDNTMSLLTANMWQFPNALARQYMVSVCNTNVIHGILKVNIMHKHDYTYCNTSKSNTKWNT